MTIQDVETSLVLGADGARTASTGAIGARALRLAGELATRFGALIAFALLWEYGGRLGFLNAAVIPPLSDVIAALWDGLVSGPLREDLGISLTRAGIAFGAATALGIPLGLVMGQLPAAERLIDPLLQLFRQTSALALYPVFILLMGLGEASKVFVIFWATAFPILLATIGGVKEVDGKLIEMARVYGAGRLTIFARVVLPGAIPQIFVGLRLSATSALLMLIAAEMIGANHGVGFQVMNAQYNFQIPLMFAAIILLALLGLAANYAILALQRRLCRWNAAG
ncbi:ABC transporter permease [Oryzibacter oryziterrae]|uniref:ABC transporter permease n=1 Tax=Oryzibacter oryziterrae TaxID=2766474 RepID=UPI001F19D452|nr:ABC transporter permease [Oryzibacter oryziterrae]